MSCFLFLWVLFIWKACFLGPGPFQALLLSALLRQNPASGLWAGPPACWLPPTPSRTGPGGPSLLTPPPPRPGREVATLLPASQKQLGGHQAHRGQLHGSCFAWTSPRPPAQASALIMSPLCLTARAGPTGIPDHSGELSDTEALSSPSLGPKPSHQQVFHHPNPRAQSLMPMVTRQQSPGE